MVSMDLQVAFGVPSRTRCDSCIFSGRATGEAYIQFATRHEAGEALRTKNRQHLGNRYIE